LAQIVAATFAEGFETVVLENHGIVTGGDDLLTAFGRLETADFCARTLLQARRLGKVNTLTEAQLAVVYDNFQRSNFTPNLPSSRERALRQLIVDMVHRAYDRQLMTSTQGTASARLDRQDFLITSKGTDRHLLDIEDIVLIQDGKCETDKQSSHLSDLHEEIYRQHAEINYIMTAQAPNILAYAVTSTQLNTSAMFESYYLLRDIPVLPYGIQYQNPHRVAEAISADTPVILIQNDCLVTTGQTILQAFDRLEVAESTAKVLIDTDSIGKFDPLTDEQIQEVDVAFSL
jgi:L-fuculose-phosphate aldolase